jgi:membrane protease YdiL (CAAX protease family)
MPTGATTQPVSGESPLILVIFLAWAVVGLVLARSFGAFGKNSIVGPERLREQDSGWDPFILFCMAFSLTSMGIGLVLRKQLSADQKLLVLSAEGSLGACVVIVVLTSLFRPGMLRSLGTNLKWIPAGVSGGAVTLFVLYPLIMLTGTVVAAVYRMVNAPQPGAHELLQLLGSTHNRAMMAATVGLAVVVAPIAEELMYRGLLQTALVRGFWALMVSGKASVPADDSGVSALNPPTSNPQVLNYFRQPTVFSGKAPAPARWAGVVVAALVFAAVHMNLAFFFPIFVLALGLGYVYERTGNIWVNIATHSLFNGAQILFFMAAMR